MFLLKTHRSFENDLKYLKILFRFQKYSNKISDMTFLQHDDHLN